MDIGLRMYKWGPPLAQGGEASVFSHERFDPTWGGNPPVFYPAGASSGTTRSARNPLNRRDPAGHVHRLDRAGHRVHLHAVITRDTPCTINGIVTQRDGNYLDSGDEGFIEPHADSVRPASRHGVGDQSENRHPRCGRVVPRRHRRRVRAAGRWQRGVPLNTDDLLHRLDSYLNAGGAASPVPNTNGPVRTDNRSGRTTSASRRRFSGNSARTSWSTRRMSASRSKYLARGDEHQPDPVLAPVRSGLPRPDGRRQLPRIRARCRTRSCVRFWATATSCVSKRADGRPTIRFSFR